MGPLKFLETKLRTRGHAASVAEPSNVEARAWRTLLGSLAMAGTGLWLAAAPAWAEPLATRPPVPVFLNDVHGFDQENGETTFVNPYVPPVSNSLDHRIGLMRKTFNGPGGKNIRFFLLTPESLQDDLLSGPAGAQIVSETVVDVAISSLVPPIVPPNGKGGGGNAFEHVALCDPKANRNPVVCGDGNDCYSLKLIVSTEEFSETGEKSTWLWSAPVDVEVIRPKAGDDPATPGVDEGASLLDVDVGAFERATQALEQGTFIQDFHTPMIVHDNRLLIVRFGAGTDVTWDDGTQVHTAEYDPVYSYYSDSQDECDIDRWTDFKPLAFLPHDPDLAGEVGLAAYPFRSPSGAAIPPTANIKGRYLWVDQAANNIFFGSLNRRLINSPTDCDWPYRIECVDGSSCSNPCNGASENGSSPHQGWMMAGLWTHGKMVLLDSLVNHSDFGLRGEKEHHRMVELFEDAGGSPVSVRVGTGRHAERFADNPPGWINTTVQFGSMEHFFNMVGPLQPRTPRDVVWQITAGARSDEIAFDDYISHRTLIFSPMNALKEMVDPQIYYDGNQGGGGGAMRLQNAATSLEWQTPAYGAVVTIQDDGGRLENVALGGIKARGFYLHPTSRIEYAIPHGLGENVGMDDASWLISLFLDRRSGTTGPNRRLITLPNGGRVELQGSDGLRFCAAGGCEVATLPKGLPEAAWTHLAIFINHASLPTRLQLYQDGFLFADLAAPAGFELAPGPAPLVVGSPSVSVPGFGGWIDEFKVIEGPMSPELVCNHAHGSLVAVPHDYTGPLRSLLDPFEAASGNLHHVDPRPEIHRALHGPDAVASSLSDFYLCHTDYSSALGISVKDPGDPEARSIRRRLLFPEGPIVALEPRPDSVSNPFCLSCHHTAAEGGLTLAPLQVGTVPAYLDDHRQPSQPPVEMLGFLGAGYFGAGKPAENLDDPADERFTDLWTADGPIHRWTFDEAAGSTLSEWVIGDVEFGSDGTAHHTEWVPGRRVGGSRGHALEFDKDTSDGDDYVEIGSLPSHRELNVEGQAMTLTAWFKPSVPGGPDPTTVCEVGLRGSFPCTVIAKSGDGTIWSLEIYYQRIGLIYRWQAQFDVQTDDGMTHTLMAIFDDGATPAIFDFDPTVWHHLAATFDRGDMKVYLDGVLADQRHVATTAHLETSDDHPVTLGARLDSSLRAEDSFFGSLDDLRIYRRALQPWEVQDLVENTP